MNMKFFLRLIGSTIVTTGVTTSVVACGGSIANNPQLSNKYAMLLGWYSDENTTTIDEIISFDQNNNCIITANNEKIIKEHLFKDSLLVTGSSGEKLKAKDVTVAAFLADLGFLSGNQINDYSENDTKAIINLVATVKTANPGKITADATDFKVTDGICQIDIMNNKTAATLVKSYNINIRGADLQVQKIVLEKLITDMKDLKLTAEQGFKGGKPTSGFKLEFNDNGKQTKFDTLITMLKTVVTKYFFATNKEGEPLTTFTADEATFLELHFGDLIFTRIAIGIPELYFF